MDFVNIKEQDQILMSLVHYFVTIENYSPIYVHGVKDEIWLEKLDGPYRVIRINTNHIFNEEQYSFDQYKISDILRQIKSKTLSFTINALNINLNEDENVKKNVELKNIDNINVKNLSDISQNEQMLNIFPKIKTDLNINTNGLELIFNVTNDINSKTERENKKFEKIFAPKKTFVTNAIIIICIVIYALSCILSGSLVPNLDTLIKMGANNIYLLRNMQIWRLVTYAFLHGSIMHILCNLYTLYIIGNEIEAKLGKWKMLLIYLFSAIGGGLLSAGFNNVISVGASGAIFGLFGAFLYFGFHYRLYLKEALKSQIIPVILINLAFGFIFGGIDNACHIGGLITGFLSAMALGIPDEEKKDNINGFIMLFIFIAFMIYLVFFR